MTSLTLFLTLIACNGENPTPTGDPAVDADLDGFTADIDCDDADDAVNPDADERCNGIDDDCDGTTDIDATDADTYFADGDADGFGAGPAVLACDAPAAHTTNDADCNDADAAIHPDAQERCDAVDHDCDGDAEAAAVDATVFYADADLDGYGDASNPTTACTLPPAHATNDADCDDTDAAVNPDLVWYTDADFDGYGDPLASTTSCEQPPSTTADGTDCDDSTAAVNPGEIERCDGLDNDCDQLADAASCSDYNGTWTGTFQLGAVEAVGSFVVNSMQCTGGTLTLTVDPANDPVVTGTSSCTYSGGLGGFDSTQTGTFEADLMPDGTFSGTYAHEYGSNPDDSYSFDGDFGAATLVGDGGYLPSSFSAVAWQVDFDSVLTQN